MQRRHRPGRIERFNEIDVSLLGLETTLRAQRPKPGVAQRDVADFISQNDVENAQGLAIPYAAQLVHDGRSRVQTARLKHARHQGHARQWISCSTAGHQPQTVVRREIAVVVSKFAQTLAQKAEMIGLLDRNTDPAGMELSGKAAVARDAIECEVDRVEFDVCNGMQQGRVPLGRRRSPPRHLQRVDEFRLFGTARHEQRFAIVFPRLDEQLASFPGCADRGRGGPLFFGVANHEGGAGGRMHGLSHAREFSKGGKAAREAAFRDNDALTQC